MPCESSIIFKRAVEVTIQDAIDISKNQIDENALANLIDYKSIAWDFVDRSYNKPMGDFQSLIHGDAWQNNAMYRFEKKIATEIALIDFQHARVTSPAIDVIYAIYTGTEPESRSKNPSNLLQIYYKQLSHELNIFGYNVDKIYPYNKLKEDFQDLFPVGLTWAFMVSRKSQFGSNDDYHRRLIGLINEAIRNNFI